jgi:hypothetical protein
LLSRSRQHQRDIVRLFIVPNPVIHRRSHNLSDACQRQIPILPHQFDQPFFTELAVVVFRLGHAIAVGDKNIAISWTREEVDDRLHEIMISIHKACYETAEQYGTPGNYVNGANIAGFLKVANSMLDQGLV